MNECSYNIFVKVVISMPSIKQIELMESMLKVASDATRLKIMFSLLDDNACAHHCDCGHCEERGCMIEKCVSDIHHEIGASQSLVSHQLKILKDADLVGIRKEGTKVFYSIKDGHVKELLTIVLEHVKEKE